MPPKLTFYSFQTEKDSSAQLTASQPAGSWQAGTIKHDMQIDYDTRTQIVTITVKGISLDEQVSPPSINTVMLFHFFASCD
jgi:hypothetical protein